MKDRRETDQGQGGNRSRIEEKRIKFRGETDQGYMRNRLRL